MEWNRGKRKGKERIGYRTNRLSYHWMEHIGINSRCTG